MSELKVYHCNEWHNEYTEFYLKPEADKVIARHKYKRCLAMAMWCNACLYQFPSFGRPSKKEKWWSKWNDKWLAIAEKFKEC